MKTSKWRIVLLILVIILIGCDKDGTTQPDDNNHRGGLVINEFMAINDSTIADDNSDYDDWIELYNGDTEAIDVGGMYVSDDVNNIDAYQIPTTNPATTTIPSKSFLLLWTDRETAQGILHVDIKLSGNGEAVVLTDSDRVTIIDSYEFGLQAADVSMGRETDGANTWIEFNNPTPGASNN